MPDRLSPGKTTTALSIGLSQDRSVKLATGDTIIKKRKNKNKSKTSKEYNDYWNLECENTEQMWKIRGIIKITRSLQMGCNWIGRDKMDRIWRRNN